jgi:hypothetical protein
MLSAKFCIKLLHFLINTLTDMLIIFARHYNEAASSIGAIEYYCRIREIQV